MSLSLPSIYFTAASTLSLPSSLLKSLPHILTPSLYWLTSLKSKQLDLLRQNCPFKTGIRVKHYVEKIYPMGKRQQTICIFSASNSEKAMAPHSSTLAWKIPWTEEPGRLQSIGSRRVRHDWATSLSLFTFMHWRRKWQPTPVFLPGESQGRGSLIGSHLWGCTESDTTEAT